MTTDAAEPVLFLSVGQKQHLKLCSVKFVILHSGDIFVNETFGKSLVWMCAHIPTCK